MKQGFTLVEVLITITILSILTLMIASALPKVRNNQKLTLDAQQIERAMHTAVQRAMNEVREEACLTLAGSQTEEQKRCSNVGIAFQDSQMIMYSDLNGDRLYTGQGDYVQETFTLRSAVEAGGGSAWLSFLVEASPPNILLFKNAAVVSESSPISLRLISGSQNRELTIFPYGRVE